ncbi:two-component sensor histidine kinase [Paenibacillus sp. FSL H8-0548]|uniref:sensor histidine kinase n=1 Tax=Paenibacillus sp. FSL H8-0548 TaxID=1920422 RepID=UPI00096D030D|nr:sensor histidine kinase [Paenibacillus sp. FSL H8-0548]OMF38085.1 two-component sensor histidine kinase [Paenibacillus sp. FSL H8-0548]
MSKLFHWYASLGLATKQFIYLFIVTLLIVLLLAWRNLHEAESLLQNQLTRDAELLVSRTNQYIDASLDNVENLLLLISTRTDLLDEGNEETAIDTLRKFADHNNSIAKTLYMVRTDGSVYSSSQVYYDIIGNPHLKDLYDLALQNYGAINVSEPYYSPMSGYTLAYVLPITDAGKQVRGVVVAEMNLDLLTERIAPMIYQSYILFSKDGNVINRLDSRDKLLPFQQAIYPPKVEEDFRKQLTILKVGVSSVEGYGLKPLVAVKSSKNRLGWSLAAFIEEDYFYKDLQKLNNNYRTAIIIWIIVLLFSAFLLSRSFTHPIRRFVEKMDRLNDLQVVAKLPVTRSDEIGRLTQSYNAMLERIQILLQKTKSAEEQKKEYELKMLRSQIAPHFLYNTLACISSLAKQQRTDEVRDTIRSLVKLLSFSFDKQSEYVSLEEELEGLRMYIQIQQVRYGEQYRYETDINPSLLHYRVLKLTLQPLVENALFHGITPNKAGLITIKGELWKGKLRLYIRDDGIGIPREKIRELLNENAEQERSMYRFTGIGLRNVHDRIRIHHGEPYGLRMGSKQGIGTIVRVDIPILTESDERLGIWN